ncbi:unnamed protein product [Camellia sinensis]
MLAYGRGFNRPNSSLTSKLGFMTPKLVLAFNSIKSEPSNPNFDMQEKMRAQQSKFLAGINSITDDGLVGRRKYKEAAELAAESPQGILRTSDTVAKFQSVPVQAGQIPPLLQYFGTLLTRGKLNAFESLELSRLFVNQNKKNLLENWLVEDKLECSEELRDLVKTVDNDLALKFNIKARVTPKVVTAFAEKREFDKILIHSKQFLPKLHTLVLTNNQLTNLVEIDPLASLPKLQFLSLLDMEATMERARSQETGIFKKKPADLMQIFKDVQSKVSDVVLGKEKPVEESNPEYEKLKHYIFELEDHLAEAQKHAYRLVKRHRELGQSLSDFGKAVKLLGTCEGDALGKVFSELGTKSEILSIKLQKEFSGLIRRLPCCWQCSLESVSMAAGGLSMVAAVMVSGVLCFDIYVSKGMPEVLNGKIMIISSGQLDAITRARPILSAMSEKLYVFEGALGAGSKIKMVIELLEGIHFVSSVVAISLGAQAGIHPWIIYDIISNAAGNSCGLDESIMPDGFLSNLKVAFQHLIAAPLMAWEKVYGVNITNAVNMLR